MKAFLIVGMTGTGKTTEVKKLLSSFSGLKYIYDLNIEYTEYQKRNLPTIENFLIEVKKTSNSIVVFEEATIFFSSRGYVKEVVDLLVRKRHSKNIYIFVFHSIRSIPSYIFELIDFFGIKQTNDTLTRIQAFKSQALIEAFENVEKSAKLDAFYIQWVKGSDL